MSDPTSVTCTECGHDVFVELTNTETRRYGRFELVDGRIVQLEEHDGMPEQLTNRTLSVILRCERCGHYAYDWLSPIGADAPGKRTMSGEELIRSLDPVVELAQISERLKSAASTRVPTYPPDKLRQLLDDARQLERMLRRERMRSALLEMADIQNEPADGSGWE